MKQGIKSIFMTLFKAIILTLAISCLEGIVSLFIQIPSKSVFLGIGFILICIAFMSLGGDMFARADMPELYIVNEDKKDYEKQEDRERDRKSTSFGFICGIAGVLLILMSVYIV